MEINASIFLNYFQVERVEIKDVRLPVALQRAMAAEAEATREARAKVSPLNSHFCNALLAYLSLART